MPPKLKTPPAPIVAIPLFTRLIGPKPVVVVMAALNANNVPAKETPPTVFVVIAPLNVEVPVPANCVKVLALIVPAAVILLTELIVKPPRRVVAPTVPFKLIVPVPATRVRF